MKPLSTAFLPVSMLLLALATSVSPGCAAVPPEAQQQGENSKIAKIKEDCKVSDSETNPSKINKASACVERAIQALRRRASIERALNAAVAGGESSETPRLSLPAQQVASQGNVGASSSSTTSTCGAGTGDNNPLIRVHRLLMAPKSASDDFGRRLGKRYIIYQVTISNDNKDFQYLIHDVSVDLSRLFKATPGTYIYQASSQDLSMLRGIPEKGQDLDPRNLILHLLQGIGGVAGAVSGLTPFSDVMGSSLAVFNGSFLQGYTGLAPDHTGTQLNRLSDSAYITNTVVDKQRARTIAIFVPEETLLSGAEQKQFWKNPYDFLQTSNFDQADICVDGAFITTVAAPTLTAAVLTPKPLTATIGPNVDATLTVIGTNLSTSDTQVVGLGDTKLLTTASGTSGSVDVHLPANYTAGMPVHLASAANPSIVSATIPTTVFTTPTLASATLKAKAPSTTVAANSTVTVNVVGTNLSVGDTQVSGIVAPTLLTTVAADGKSGNVDIQLPPNYTASMQVYLVSHINPSVQTSPVTPTVQQ